MYTKKTLAKHQKCKNFTKRIYKNFTEKLARNLTVCAPHETSVNLNHRRFVDCAGCGTVTGGDLPRWACPFCSLFLRSIVCIRATILWPYIALSWFEVGSTAYPVAFTLGFLPPSPLHCGTPDSGGSLVGGKLVGGNLNRGVPPALEGVPADDDEPPPYGELGTTPR